VIVIVATSPTAYEALSSETVYVSIPPAQVSATALVIVAPEIAFVCLIVTVDVAAVDPQVNTPTPDAVEPMAVSIASTRSEVTAPEEDLGACPVPNPGTVAV